MDRLTPERLDVLLDGMRRARVVVIGDLMLDIYLNGAASRISPEAPVPVVRIANERLALGGAANVASNVVALGAACDLVGCVGADRAGNQLRDTLGRLGIGDSGVQCTEGRPTTVKTRIMARHHQVARFDVEVDHDVDATCAAALVAATETLASSADTLVLEDYNKGVLVPEVIDAALATASRLGIPVVVDPKARNFFAYRGATIFKPNRSELAAALRETVHEDDAAWLDHTRHDLGCAHLLVTLGEAGMALMTADGEYVRVPTAARSVYDVSGAGDTVTAVVAAALAAGASPSEAAILANHAAGIEVGKAGVANVTPDELRATVRQRQNA